MVDVVRTIEWSTNFEEKKCETRLIRWRLVVYNGNWIWKQFVKLLNEKKRKKKKNLENGEEYVGIIETPYWNLTLDRQILKTKKRHARHRSFLPQEVW